MKALSEKFMRNADYRNQWPDLRRGRGLASGVIKWGHCSRIDMFSRFLIVFIADVFDLPAETILSPSRDDRNGQAFCEFESNDPILCF